MKTVKKAAKTHSITAMVKEALKRDFDIGYEKAKGMVKKAFPRSRFNERHFSWYKSAYKRGALKGVR